MRRAGHGPVVLDGGELNRLAPQSRASASTRWTASDEERTCGAIAHGRPSNSAAVAASGPDGSLPAIGRLPT